MTLRVFSRLIRFVTAVVIILSGPAMASVVMLNTRVIYPGDAKSQTLQFSNNDKIPYVLQLWADKNNPLSTPETADAPFMVIPAMFRVEPATGQSVRLVFTGQNLPQDRESIFYLNTVQIPPKNMAGQGENQMTVILRNRVKIFYRPKQIAGSPDQITKQLRFKLKSVNGSWVLQANNDSGYYATVVSAAVILGKKEIAFLPNMIAPKSSAEWSLDKKGQTFASADKIKFTLINDYGGKTTAEVNLDK